MSYVVLARKYRPRSFDQMVGQEHVVRALSNALQQQRLHHAYLFTGTRGIGKTTVSRILAKSLNCTGADGSGGITAHPCGTCQACTEIDADRYLDYIEMDAASNGGKDEIRDLIERAAYKPGIGRFKVFMIDEAHQLSKDAFNALLKTLEEPPEYLKFVLATTDPDKVLPTVLSRCLQFNLRPMAPETVRGHLVHVLGAEHVPFDDGAIRLLSRAARGSMRDALSLTDQAIAYGGGQLTDDTVRTMLGTVDRSHARNLVQALAQRDGPAVLAAVDALRGLGLSASGLLEEMAALLQQMAVQQAVPGALDAQDPDTEDACRLAALMPADDVQLLYSIVLHGRAEISLMSDEYGALTMVLLRLLAFPAAAAAPAASPQRAPSAPPRAAPLRAPSAPPRAAPLRAPSPPATSLPMPLPKAAAPKPTPESAAAALPERSPATSSPPQPLSPPKPPPPPPPPPKPQPQPPPQPPTQAQAQAQAQPEMQPQPRSPAHAPAAPRPAPVASGPAPATPLGDRWAGLLGRLAASGALVALTRELAWQAGLLAVDDGAAPPVWRLQVERETLRAPALRDKLCAALAAELGHPIDLQLEPGTPADSPARRDAAERASRQALAEETIRTDPVVLALMAQYKTARIVPGSIKPV